MPNRGLACEGRFACFHRGSLGRPFVVGWNSDVGQFRLSAHPWTSQF